jgi:hypothetical protein
MFRALVALVGQFQQQLVHHASYICGTCHMWLMLIDCSACSKCTSSNYQVYLFPLTDMTIIISLLLQVLQGSPRLAGAQQAGQAHPPGRPET